VTGLIALAVLPAGQAAAVRVEAVANGWSRNVIRWVSRSGCKPVWDPECLAG
jgi:hypothetical protein